MASLTSILHQRSRVNADIEKGRVFLFSPATTNTQFSNSSCVYWCAPSNGVAIIEIWGASGSGARQCCCAVTIPGNPGAYSKKIQCVQTNDWIRGIVGMSCGNSDSICFRGCSQSTCITICRVTANCCMCMCAEGGYGGISYCSTSTGGYCCFGNAGSHFAVTCFNSRAHGLDCGLVCNFQQCRYSWGKAFGGDVNKDGGVSCVSFLASAGSQGCCYIFHTAVSPGIIAEDGVVLSWTGECDSGVSAATGSGQYQTMINLGLASKRPTSQHMVTGCWSGHKHCGCYESNGCIRFNPPGVPGAPFMNGQGDVRGGGFAGGHGMMRIKFIGNT